jgi:hypothetical protein
MKSHREGKITLRTYNVEAAPLPKVDWKLIRDTRKRLPYSLGSCALTNARLRSGNRVAQSPILRQQPSCC